MIRRRPTASLLELPPAGARGIPGDANLPARETPRMRSGHRLTRSFRLVTVAAGLGLFFLTGCYRDQYDVSLTYPVRSDWIVNPNTTWEQQPTTFNPPGRLPLDSLALPERER